MIPNKAKNCWNCGNFIKFSVALKPIFSEEYNSTSFTLDGINYKCGVLCKKYNGELETSFINNNTTYCVDWFLKED